MDEFDIVVIGGGPAGLSAAIEAQEKGASAVVLEAAGEAGGLTRSFEQDGYTFDCSGHLLHLSDPEAVALVERATSAEDWNRIDRDSVIYLENAFIPYPFQLHLAYAPERVRRECVELLPEEAPGYEDPELLNDFGSWITANLGDGIGRWFMVPYNEKLSTVPVGDLTCEWLGRFVPRPGIEEIRQGAAQKRTRQTGYNRSFLYPRQGGIATMSRGLARLVPNLVTGAPVTAVDTEARIVRSGDGREFSYRRAVVATQPLPELAAIVTPADERLERRRELRANSVTCVNVGVRDANPAFASHQWVYLPEERFASYRFGFYARFAESMAPPGREGMYVEVAHGPEAAEAEVVDAAIGDLLGAGVIDDRTAVETVLPVRIETAYVIHDRATSGARAALREALEERGIFAAGRYGNWEYSAMEDAIVGGMHATREALASGSAARR
ncbi:MAG TPA: FAD-dependent oxidoreductase [Solirubrobacterales bacterium]|nr:FAD-dependent oxidoreductase [Solirubrobacterales bacterium]